MTFQTGNRWWEARSSHGRNPKFQDAAELWHACCEYFEWIDQNPLKECRVFAYEGEAFDHEVPKMHAMTIAGLCNFLDIARSTWDNWKNTRGGDFLEVIERAEGVIYHQKFAGAAANLLNANIIARDLGLADKTEQGGTLHISLAGKDADL